MNVLDYFLQFPWVEPLGWTLLHFLWQGTAIAMVTALLLRVLHRSAPNLRHVIACGSLLLCLVVLAATFVFLARPFSMPKVAPRVLTNASEVESGSPASTGFVEAIPASPPRNAVIAPSAGPKSTDQHSLQQAQQSAEPSEWPVPKEVLAQWTVIGWLAGVAILGLRLGLGWLRIQLWRIRARPLTDPVVLKKFQDLLARFELTRRVRLFISDTAVSPLTLGWIRPAIFLPVRVVTGLSVEEVEAILAHELAHIRRYDYLVNLIQSAVEVVLFYHPAIWWLSRQVRETREECCDEDAVRASVGRLQLATALAALAEMRLPPQPALAARSGALLNRVSRLLGLSRPAPMMNGRNAAWTLTLASLVAVIFGIVYSARLVAAEPDETANTKSPPRGSVVDDSGHPVPGARVMLYYAKHQWGVGNKIVEEVRTDDSGQFAFREPLRFTVPNGTVESDHYTLVAMHQAHAPAWAQIVGGGPEQRDFSLRLTRPVSQSYEVVDTGGKPVAGATVWLRFARWDTGKPQPREPLFVPGDLGIASAVTDVSGKATLTNLPNTARSVAASAPHFEDNLSCTTPKEGIPRFTLVPDSTLEGRVTDPLGVPVAGAKVWLYPKFRYYQYFFAVTDAHGVYRVEKIWSTGNAPDWGKYKVGILHPGFTTEEREVAFTPRQAIKDFDLTAVPGTEIVGRLIDPQTKEPVGGGSVMVESKSGRQTLTTNLRGEFRTRVIPGEISVFYTEPPGGTYVVNPGGGNTTTRAFGSQMAISLLLPSRLGKLGTMTGKVLNADGQPVAKCKLSVVVPGTRVERGRWSGNSWPNSPSESDGSFELDSIPIGLPFRVLATSNDGKMAGTASGLLSSDRAALETPVTLRSTSSAEIQVVDLDGKVRPNLAVEVSMRLEGESLRAKEMKTDAEGYLRVPNVLPGIKYRIRQTDSDYAFGEAELIAAQPGKPAQRKTVTVTDQYAVRLEGPDGRPVQIKSFKNFYVWILRDGQRTRWTDSPIQIVERRDEEVLIRRNAIALAKAGDKIDFLIETEHFGLVNASGVVPGDEGAIVARSTDVVGQMDSIPDPSIPNVAPEEIAGRVVGPDGRPLAGATVAFSGAHWLGDNAALQTDADGIFRVPDAREKWFTYATVKSDGFAPIFLTDINLGEGFKMTLQNSTRLRGTIAGENPGKVALVLEKNKKTLRERMGYEVRDVQFRVSTDEHGAYDFPMEPGTYRYIASSADGRFARGEVTVPADGVVALPAALKSGLPLTVQLADWQTGKPVPGIEIGIRTRRPDGVVVDRENSKRISDAQGVVSWQNLLPGETEFDAPRMAYGTPGQPGFEQHPYCRWWRMDEPVKWLRIDAKAKPPTGSEGVYSLRVDLGEGMGPVRVLMERGVKISGLVEGPDGTPVQSINVGVVSDNGRSSLTGDSRFTFQTDEKGAFSGYIPAGNGFVYHLCAYEWAGRDAIGANAVSEPFASKPGDEFQFHLRMEKGAWVTGRLVDAQGQPAAGHRVSSKALDAMDIPYGDRIVETGADGQFRLGPLRPGRYEVRAGYGAGAPMSAYRNMTPQKITAANGRENNLGDFSLPEKPQRED